MHDIGQTDCHLSSCAHERYYMEASVTDALWNQKPCERGAGMNQKIEAARRGLEAFMKWLVLSTLTGAITGVVGVGFQKSVVFATSCRTQYPWLLFLLPAGGVLLVWLYHLFKQPIGLGTADLFVAIQDEGRLPLSMPPLIFVATFITHLLGGSAGREGAALQLGGGIANALSRFMKLDDHDRDTLTLIGMGSLFSALFGTPVTAMVFVMEVIALGHMIYSSIVPCAIASCTAYGVALILGAQPEAFALANVPEFGLVTLIKVTVLGALCACLSILFCESMHKTHAFMAKRLENPYLRVIAGGTAIIVLTLLVGTRDYNGAGGDVIERAIEGVARPQDFLLKLVFTAITLSCGFKGGEIVPTFFVGATFGCMVGPLMGLDPGFAAAVALAATFCGNTNCPIAATFLAMELFGGQGMPLFIVACSVSYMLSGKYSLYNAQRISFESEKLGKVVLPRPDRRRNS